MNEPLPEIRIEHHPGDATNSPWRVSIGEFMVAMLPDQEKCLTFVTGYIEGWAARQESGEGRGGEHS